MNQALSQKKETTDTIGSIMIYNNEELGSATMIIATSSGGPWLKMPGRMGSVRLNSILMLSLGFSKRCRIRFFIFLN